MADWSRTERGCCSRSPEALMRSGGRIASGCAISPLGKLNDIMTTIRKRPLAVSAERLSDYGLAYLHIVNPAMDQMQSGQQPEPRALGMAEMIRKKYKGTLIVAGGFQADTAEQWLQEGRADLIAFGRKFIANPDLPERLRAGGPFNVDDPRPITAAAGKDTPTILHWRRIAASSRKPASTKAGGEPSQGRRSSSLTSSGSALRFPYSGRARLQRLPLLA